jgi:ring-1,2-phenylacetyl-CoA epoxidase subunit PaaC
MMDQPRIVLHTLREAHEYRNHLLVELPNGDWAQSVLKIFFFAAWHKVLYEQLLQSKDERLISHCRKEFKGSAFTILNGATIG